MPITFPVFCLNINKMRKIKELWILLILFSTLQMACNKEDTDLCVDRLVSNQEHLVSDEVLKEMDYRLQIIEDAGDFQIRDYSTDSYGSSVKCNQFYNGLPIFSGDVNFIFRNDGSISQMGNTIDSLNISLSPQIDHHRAAELADEKMNSGSCYAAELGIFDINSGKGGDTSNFKLSWRITDGKSLSKYALVDAQSEAILRYDSGIRF